MFSPREDTLARSSKKRQFSKILYKIFYGGGCNCTPPPYIARTRLQTDCGLDDRDFNDSLERLDLADRRRLNAQRILVAQFSPVRLTTFGFVQPDQVRRIPIAEVGFEHEAIPLCREPETLDLLGDSPGLKHQAARGPRTPILEIANVEYRCPPLKGDRLSAHLECDINLSVVTHTTNVGSRELERNPPLQREADPLGLTMKVLRETHDSLTPESKIVEGP